MPEQLRVGDTLRGSMEGIMDARRGMTWADERGRVEAYMAEPIPEGGLQYSVKAENVNRTL